MQWSDEALGLLEKIPDEIRPMAKQMMELYASQQGIDSITDDLMKDVRKSFESQYGEQQKCPFKSDES
ncbi:MAG: PCP reductase family protein [Mariprofundaceae bacterium]